jgi:hypothetical protein
VCEAIAENLLEKYVSFPTGSNRKHVIQGYDLHISNMVIASFVVAYYIPYTLQWCGVGKMTVEADRLPI